AQRLAREERSARSSLGLAHQQTLLNRLVIEELADGVMVIGRQGLVRTLNPAARALLGAMDQAVVVPFMLADQPGLHGLQHALDQAFQQGRWPDAAREICLALADGDVRTLQLRARFTRRGGMGADDKPSEDICVLFLQDLRSVQDQARQHKLAAMGQVSAGIAHEIRNPLAAISQAIALLLEDELPGTQRQLAHIVADNAGRLKRIVDDVLAAAPGAEATPVVIDARVEVALVFDDWCRASSAQTRVADRLICDFPTGSLPAYFDVEHLRRVLVNLLDNAVRHAGPSPGAVRLSLVAGPLPGMVTLSVASDGVAMAAEVERRLFEPFFSTRSRGSGLGLYICRELCERHGASIEFIPGPAGSRYSNVFAVMMRAGPAV
ncbi:MAG: histidine kinase, partial [Betaproteobacteria bacterium]|nr:histidine kinase [Betaproteobacteria bacterium]